MKNITKILIVCTPSLSAWGMFEPPTKFSKGEGLGRISVFRGGLLGKRSDFFQEGVT